MCTTPRGLKRVSFANRILCSLFTRETSQMGFLFTLLEREEALLVLGTIPPVTLSWKCFYDWMLTGLTPCRARP